MDNEQLYIDFLEENLDSQIEYEFAQKFAMDNDFRNGFKTFLKLTNTISQNLKVFGPTIEETDRLFSKLGYTVPSGLIEAAPRLNRVNYSKIIKYLSMGILSSVVTIIIMLYFLDYGNINESVLDNRTAYSAFQNSKKMIMPYSVLNNNSAFKNESLNNRANLQNPEININDLKDLYVSEPTSVQTITALQDDTHLIIPVVSKSEIINEKRFRELNHSNFYNEIAYQKLSPYDFKINNDVIFELRNSPSYYFEEPNVSPSYYNQFNNLDICIVYSLNDEFRTGLNYRQETFFIKYEGVDSKGNPYTNYQQPNLSSVGLFLRYCPMIFSQKIRPLLQFTFSFNQGGIITREMAGLEYYPFENVYFILGAELNQFFYQHQQNLFNSNKLSINYGIGVKL